MSCGGLASGDGGGGGIHGGNRLSSSSSTTSGASCLDLDLVIILGSGTDPGCFVGVLKEEASGVIELIGGDKKLRGGPSLWWGN